MTYSEATNYLFNRFPMFQSKGPGAYKPGLETSMALDSLTGHPHRKFRSIHIAGTNGKGSTAHSLAAAAMASGLKTGLYTSPHLLDFRERIRVDGRPVPEERVVDFVERFKDVLPGVAPSFFELTTAMAFEYFASQEVDIAIVETGLGGRLDSTNIITPLLSVITNISLDHTALLGDTPEAIAREKAGIIKPGVPVVIGEAGDPDVRHVFERRAAETESRIVFAEDIPLFGSVEHTAGGIVYHGTPWGDIACDLAGDCQPRNMATVLTALKVLPGGLIDMKKAVGAMSSVADTTGLAGRWMRVADKPLTIADTGHNAGGWQYLARQIDASVVGVKHLVLGFVNDKDLAPILPMVAEISNARLYFTRPSVDRGLPASALARCAEAHGLHGEVFDDVAAAYKKARAESGAGDMVYVGGSTFVVADLLEYLNWRQ